MTFVSKSSGSIMISAIVSSISMLGNFASLRISGKYFLFMSENISKGSGTDPKTVIKRRLVWLRIISREYLAIIMQCFQRRISGKFKAFKLFSQISPLVIQNCSNSNRQFLWPNKHTTPCFRTSCITVNKEKQNKWLKNQAAPRVGYLTFKSWWKWTKSVKNSSQSDI